MRPSAFQVTSGVVAVAALLGGACSGDDDDPFADGDGVSGDPGDCVVVDAAVSSEKIELLTELAEDFNATDAEVDGECVFVDVRSKASGGAATALAEGWDETTDGPRPVLWSPASSAWGEVLNQRLARIGQAKHGERSAADLGSIIDETVNVLRSNLPASVQLVFDPPGHIPRVAAETEQLRRLLRNLVQNGVEALSGAEGRVEIAVRTEEFFSPQSGQALSGAVISVRDTGCGIEDECLGGCKAAAEMRYADVAISPMLLRTVVTPSSAARPMRPATGEARRRRRAKAERVKGWRGEGGRASAD